MFSPQGITSYGTKRSGEHTLMDADGRYRYPEKRANFRNDTVEILAKAGNDTV